MNEATMDKGAAIVAYWMKQKKGHPKHAWIKGCYEDEVFSWNTAQIDRTYRELLWAA